LQKQLQQRDEMLRGGVDPDDLLHSGCQNNVPMVGRYFVTTTDTAILFSGTLF
jgi:hypothetical protein